MNQNNENKTERKEEQPNTIDTLTKEQATESNAIEIPKVELPKGGGALKGIDEKFEVNAANGTASFSIPLPIAPGRNGFSPSLALSYSSGGGNSAFGLGWSVSYPMIQRKTDKKLPTYQQEDTFMFSGAEDLVPLLERDAGEWKKKSINNENYTILRYRPRVEGGFARIERIFRKSDKQTYWKVTTRENITTFFGLTPESRIADPQDDQKIYTWLPAFSYDDKGNWIKYEYKAENLENVANELHERNRYNGIASFTNRYLKRVKYGNRVAWYADEEQPYNPTLPTDDAVYFFELVMDYGEHQDPETPEEIPTYNEKNRWLSRPDAFSSYRAGFEVRTYRRCYNILMFHHFEEERQFVGTSEEEDFGKEYLVSALALKYAPSSINQSGQTEVSYLASVTQEGYIRKENDYFVKSLPPMEFDYQPLDWNTKVRVVDQESIANAPVGLTNNYQWVDLYGEGINGILTEQAEAWYYKSNLGDTDEDQQVKFTPAQKVINKPSFIGITSGTLSLQDLEANGEKQVVVNSPGVQGYFTLTEDNTYQAFQPFETVSSIDIQDPHVRLLDLDGDGQPEIVLTEENVFTWYTSNGTKGYEAAKQSSKPFNEEQGPALVFADTDQQESIFLADMTGDGLTDIVRVRNGEICYWANKGYGKFSAKVSMNNTPLFDLPDQFNPRYLQLVDVSGTGATDLIYLGKNKFKAYINLSGNAWSEAQEIEPFFPIDGNTKISVVDLLGTGTSCIVWSSDLPAESQAPMRYIDLMDSKKPHILTKYVNNFGKETTLTYKSSTYYYLKDKQAGKPWATKLPFPVQVVAKTVVEDKITDVRFSAEYAYHHGYYDHAEREFRGFGMVEQKDTEEYENWQSNNAGNRLERSYDLYQPSTLTKTWFHTGAFIDKERLLSYFEKEYWYQAYQKAFPDPTILTIEQAYQLPETQIVTNPTIANNFDINQLSAEEYREALRACKGMVLRQEIFALDAEKRSQEEQQQKGYADDPDFLAFKTQAQQTELKPYTVATHNCHIQLLQARGDNPHASFMVTESEALTLHYERDERDLRIAHSLNTQIDKLGNILASAAVVYPRKNTDALNTSISEAQALLYQRGGEKTTYLQHLQQLQQAQAKTHIIYTQNEFTNDVLQDNSYRLRLPTEVKTFEVTGLAPSATLYQLEDFQDVLGNNTEEIAYTATPNETDVQRRLIEHVRTLYYNEALTDTLPLGQLPTHGISYESYQLAYTSNLLNELFTGKIVDTDNLMNNEGKFVQSEGDNNWWIRSGLPEFVDATNGEDITTVRARFFSPIRYRSPFDAVTSVTYYKDYYLLLQASEDALQNRMEVERFNFRVLAPTRMKDPNDNLAEVLLDELGLVKATATLGKGNEADNLDDLTEYTPQAERDTIENYFTLADSDDLQLAAKNLLQKASARFVYNFHRYQTSVQLRAEQRANNPNVTLCEEVKYLPTVVGSITREQHAVVEADSDVQLGFEYTDGMSNVAMTKVQAEPGEALQLNITPNCDYTLETIDTGSQLRWIGNGRTVLNNKGNPVKQYEPYFSVNPFYEDNKELVERGVTPILYYDALGRGVRTEFPDGTFTKVVFDSWHQKYYDQNDTILDSNWYQNRINNLIDAQLLAEGKDPNKEKAAAEKAAWHYDTPNILHVDSLGRPVLSVAYNRRYERDNMGTITGSSDELYSTQILLDIEGNTRAVIDARGNTVMQYAYNLLGHRVYESSMDAGEEWVLNNVAGNPIRNWDSKEQIFSTVYDLLQRPVEMRLQATGATTTQLIEKVAYGESQPNAKANNLRGQVYQQYDASGRTTHEAFDFKGNLLTVKRQLAAAYQAAVIDWTDGSPTNRLESEVFTQDTEYDALNRMQRLFNWYTSAQRVTVYLPTYNARGVLVSEEHLTDADKANMESTGRRITAVNNITYNEKGQRMRMRYGNGTNTYYHYDTETFRLIQLKTTLSGVNGTLPSMPSNLSDPNVLQNLYYTYDAVGNISEIEDDAFEPVFFRNQQVAPKSGYIYDALYRLVEATGRENKNFNNAPQANAPNTESVNFPVTSTEATDKTLRNYTQRYQYDAVGNILQMRHLAQGNAWTRHYQYATDSNRLLATEVGSTLTYDIYTNTSTLAIKYRYDVHGNLLNYNEVASEFRPSWDYRDCVQQIDLGGGGTAYYQYDSGRERSRKRIERNGLTEERLYLGGMELYRRYSTGNTLVEEIETHHLLVDDQRILLVENVRQTNNNNLTTGILDRYQYNNHLGSVGLEVDGNGDIISYEEYHPYGTVSYQAVNATLKATAKRYRYTGMERDEESGLSYHSARYYLPWLGRWLSADPIGIGDGVNVYRYAGNNPVMQNDSNGAQSQIFNQGLSRQEKFELSKQLRADYEAKYGRQPFVLSYIDSDKEIDALNEAHREMEDEFASRPGVSNPEPPEPVDPRQRMYAVAASDPIAAVWVGVSEAAESVTEIFGYVLDPDQVATTASVISLAASLAATLAGGAKGRKPKTPRSSKPTSAQNAASTSRKPKAPTSKPNAVDAASNLPSSNVIPIHEIIPIDKIGTKKGYAIAPKEGNYRGVTKKMRKEAQRVGEKYSGPGNYDVGHRADLSGTPPGERVRLKSQERGANRGEGKAIAKANEARRKKGLYVRPKKPKK